MKKKIVLLFVLVVALIGTANAQKGTPRYQGDVQLGYSFGTGFYAADRLNLHMINGVRINEYFSTGIGLGIDYYCVNTSQVAVPIFWNAKGYLPVSEKTSLFLSMDLGCSIGTGDLSGANMFMVTPSAGVSFKVADKNAITVGLGYNYQRFKEDIFAINMGAVSLKVGFSF